MSVIKALAFGLSAFASYAAFFYKLAQFRRNWRDLVYLTLVVTLALMCLTFTMGAVSASVDELFGIANLDVLVLHLASVGLCISAQILLLQWANPLELVRTRIKLWLLAGSALCGLLVILFFIGGAPYVPPEELTVGSVRAAILTYLLLFIVSQSIPCVTVFCQCIPYARATSNPWLRRGLRLLAAGAALLFGYCLTRTVNILSPLLGIQAGSWVLAASFFSAAGIVVLAIALTMPSWGAHMSKAVDWVRAYRSYRALYPLWRSLYDSTPEIALEPPSTSVSDLHYRLHRRVVEIRDGWRALRPYMDAEASDTGESACNQATVEAHKIDQALAAKQATPVSTVPPRGGGGFEDTDAKTFAAEVSWLTEVSAAFARVHAGKRTTED